jgi:putative membrane protein insertion efficiency factor
VNLFSRAAQWLLLALVGAYRAFSTRLMPPVCRFYPSCSAYAQQALATHGPWRGAWLGAARICRCHPFNPGGVDLVPPKSKMHREQKAGA